VNYKIDYSTGGKTIESELTFTTVGALSDRVRLASAFRADLRTPDGLGMISANDYPTTSWSVALHQWPPR
jgi:hypothetical protein